MVDSTTGRIGEDPVDGMGQSGVHVECRRLEQELEKVTKRRAAVWKETGMLTQARGDDPTCAGFAEMF